VGLWRGFARMRRLAGLPTLLEELSLLLPALLVLLFPIAMYCWVLGAINRRPRPTIVSGLWDCVGMLCALSGLLLVVVPFLINRIFRALMAAVPVEDGADRSNVESMQWLTWIVYFTLLPVGAFFLLWWRRNKTVIYNLDV